MNDTALYAMQMHNTPSKRVFNYGDAEEEFPSLHSEDIDPVRVVVWCSYSIAWCSQYA